jgi:hypothetical protein
MTNFGVQIIYSFNRGLVHIDWHMVCWFGIWCGGKMRSLILILGLSIELLAFAQSTQAPSVYGYWRTASRECSAGVPQVDMSFETLYLDESGNGWARMKSHSPFVCEVITTWSYKIRGSSISDYDGKISEQKCDGDIEASFVATEHEFEIGRADNGEVSLATFYKSGCTEPNGVLKEILKRIPQG